MPTPSRPPAGSCSTAVVATDADGGRTIHLCVGGTLTVQLASTYWETVTSEPPSVLAPAGDPVVSPAPPGTCVPGGGCGTTTARFSGAGQGTAVVTARRRVCGEALLCEPSQQVFTVTVVVG